ncbi:hypothetical protein P8A18_11675 [Streptomyces castrisilvae]|uniref:Secreted protein n=1 Tax=Streptomyces castrisilvae TaxID=3033811 RepID=A0ABY9HHW8_9ACTN|nr:hypothetical protein [Streptomyces sp. Mut1]WLQ34060.1 hypothetical protein P8A18_11675 [Streptomyces sp. Mut1]
MPRPTAAQLFYGSVTVVFSTLAMLLLFRTSSGLGIAAVGTVALALGLLVSVTVPAPARRHTARPARTDAPVSLRSGIPAARTATQREHSLRH